MFSVYSYPAFLVLAIEAEGQALRNKFYVRDTRGVDLNLPLGSSLIFVNSTSGGLHLYTVRPKKRGKWHRTHTTVARTTLLSTPAFT